MVDKAQGLTEPASGRVLRWPTLRSKDWTNAFLESAKNDPNILAVVAVGSAVRPGVSSADVDFVVFCKDPSALKETPPLEVDLRAYSTADIDEKLQSGHDMLSWAVRFGQALFQRDGFWDRVVDSWRNRLPLPSAELARERAATAYRHLLGVFQAGDEDAAQEQALSYVTHLARAELLDRGVYPASRPELAAQLRGIGHFRLAEWLERLLHDEPTELAQIDRLLKLAV